MNICPQERLEQLFRGCALSRVKVGGLVMTQHPQQSEGAARSAAAWLGAVQGGPCTRELGGKWQLSLGKKGRKWELLAMKDMKIGAKMKDFSMM